MQSDYQLFQASTPSNTPLLKTVVGTESPAQLLPGSRYAMIKVGPDVRPEEVESLDRLAAEVMILWEANVLHVAHLTPPRAFSVGDSDSKAEVDYEIPQQVLGTNWLPLLTDEAGTTRLLIPEGATGQVEAPGQPAPLSLDEIRARAAKSLDVAGAFEYQLERGTRARLELNGITFHVALVPAGRSVKRGLLAATDWNVTGYFGASFMAAGALMAAMAFFVPPMNLMDDEARQRDRLYLINAILKGQAERERKQLDDPAVSDRASDEGGTGERAQAEEGSMGKQTSRATNKRYALKGSPNNPDPHLARQQGREEATTFGMIALLSGADPNAPTAPWGRDTALGLDELSAQGGMWGDEIGESYGAGGFSLSGIGEGGGGRGEGIGLGDIGFGHGAGLGLRQGFGNGVGRSSGTYKPQGPPQMRTGQASVSGRLPPEVIQRIVRQNFGRFRMCYEQGLAKNPNLSGRVAVRFAISREGTVQSAQNGGSDLPDSSVVGCVVSAFYGVTFPEPDNGIVTVSYPIMFSPG